MPTDLTIHDYVTHHNENPKAFIWTAKANDILQKVVRANSRLSSKQNEALHELGQMGFVQKLTWMPSISSGILVLTGVAMLPPCGAAGKGVPGEIFEGNKNTS